MKLLQIELEKIKGYPTFWVLMGMYVVLIGLWFFAADGIYNFILPYIQQDGLELNEKELFLLPGSWHHLTYLASWWHLFLGIIIIMLVSNEYQYRTMRQNLIDGLSRTQLVLSKLLIMLTLSIVATALLGVVILVIGLVAGVDEGVNMFDEVQYLFYFGVQAFAYMVFAALFAYLIRGTALSLVLYISYTFVIENLMTIALPAKVGMYMPSTVISNLIPNPIEEMAADTMRQMGESPDFFVPAENGAIAVAIYTALFCGILFAYIRKANL